MRFDKMSNAELEKAFTNDKTNVTVSVQGDSFVINLLNKTGLGRQGTQITVSRNILGSNAAEGIGLPIQWAPMPRDHTGNDLTVHLVHLSSGSAEYQTVVRKVQATGGNIVIRSIERVQNPHLYQTYMVKKTKMDKDNGGRNNERQLFHGTAAANIVKINTQGFNRSFSGLAHGTALGRGVYFARDASYSMGYASGGSGARQMYLAQVLVGEYTQGNSSTIVPPPKNPSKPEIIFDSVVDNTGNPSAFVVFNDSQSYPQYLITF